MISEMTRVWNRETFSHDISEKALDLLDDIQSNYMSLDDDDLAEYLNDVSKELRVRKIPREDGKPYMTRYDIHGWMPEDGDKKYPLSIYLHRFHAPDYDPAPHNHPWEWARSFILTGGYIEHRFDPESRESVVSEVRSGSLNRIEANTFHTITSLLRETWTLFSAGPKTGSWGFQVPGRGYVPWRDRLRERGLKPEY